MDRDVVLLVVLVGLSVANLVVAGRAADDMARRGVAGGQYFWLIMCTGFLGWWVWRRDRAALPLQPPPDP